MKQPATRSILMLATVVVAALAFAQLGSAQTESRTAATASTISVKGGEFYFKLSSKSIARPGKVTFVLKNVGHVRHDFKIAGRTTSRIQPGKTARLVVTFKKKAKYAYLCTVPGHAAAGMKGVFTVR